MEQIMENPLEGLHVKRLRGELEGKYRYKIGGLRIVYFVDETERTIFVEAIGDGRPKPLSELRNDSIAQRA
jgi:mRNA interferase RelE/StbE